MFGKIKSVFDYLYLKSRGVDTKLGYVRLHGLPMINKHKNSKITLGQGVTLVSNTKYNVAGINHRVILATVAEGAEIYIGNYSGISGSSIVSAQSIRIGNDAGLGVNTAIYDTDFHFLDPIKRKHQAGIDQAPATAIVIGNSVWLGANAMVLKGVTIGDNAVVGAGSIVTKDIPADTIAAGVPAKEIGKL